MALLRISGQLDVGQFWPAGHSDADTVVMQVTESSFEVQKTSDAQFVVTNAFQNAFVRGRQRQQFFVITNNRIRIRLQGVDAPELHYNATAAKTSANLTVTQKKAFQKLNQRYRQRQGETATVAFQKFVSQVGSGNRPCQFVTQVDSPSDVPDVYGRLVGDVFINVAGRQVNLNAWLLENGWAFPAFYNSMSAEEITTLTIKADAARRAKKGIWKHFTKTVKPFDFDLIFRQPGSALNAVADRGVVLLPKLFRRQCSWAVNKKAKISTSIFAKNLQAASDECYLTSDFLLHGPLSAQTRKLHEFLDANNTFQVLPHELVFRESSATLRNADNTIVTEW